MTGLKEFINGQDTNELQKMRDAVEGNATDSFDGIANKVVEATSDISEKTISTIKKYPLHTALAIGLAGFIGGVLMATRKKVTPKH